jgi:hypothetical protein
MVRKWSTVPISLSYTTHCPVAVERTIAGHGYGDNRNQLSVHADGALILLQVNGGVPKGFANLAAATKASKPSPEAWAARRKVEKAEANRRRSAVCALMGA